MSEVAALPAPSQSVATARPPHGSRGRESVSVKVLRRSNSIRCYLNTREILYQTLVSNDIDFLTKREREILWELCDRDQPSGYLAGRILSFLKARKKSKRDGDFCKFVACVIRANEHRGHLELVKIFQAKLGRKDWKHIHNILEKVRESPLPSPYTTPIHSPGAAPPVIPVISPERPVAFIALQGQVVAKHFVKIERKLWLAFSTGNYNEVELFVKTIQVNCQVDEARYNVDCKVVAMWFQSLVLMHRDGKYMDAIDLLYSAEG